MKSKVIKFKSKEDWLEFRKGGIGGSEVSAVLGVNPYMTRYQLWRLKKGLDTPQEPHYRMKIGTYMEDVISKLYQDETGRNVIKSSAGDWLVQSTEKPHLFASPDRTFWISESDKKTKQNKGVLECKNTMLPIDENNIPTYWFVQNQWEIGIHGSNFGSIAWFSRGNDFAYNDYVLDKNFFEYMVGEVDKFWFEYIIGDKIPDPETSDDILLMYSSEDLKNSLEVDSNTFQDYLQLLEYRQNRLHFENLEKELLEKLKVKCGEFEELQYMNQTLCTYKFGKESEKFDKTLFKKENPELYKKYVTMESTRRFNLKTNNK